MREVYGKTSSVYDALLKLERFEVEGYARPLTKWEKSEKTDEPRCDRITPDTK
jgi:hypothetical protein